MATEQFTTRQFGDALCAMPFEVQPHGYSLKYQQFIWSVVCTQSESVRVLILSSIGSSGYAATTGEDSIRLMLQVCVSSTWVSVGKGPDAWTTRQPNWATRLQAKIVEVKRKADKIVAPLQPGDRVSFVKKAGPNLGRPFATNGGQFRAWLDR